MCRTIVSITTVLAVTTLISCSGRNPDGPTPMPTPTGLSITSSADIVVGGKTERFLAVIAASDGTSRTVNGIWSSDVPAVARVDPPSGWVTTAMPGEARISVDAEGLRAAKRLRVVPLYEGHFTDTLTVTACTPTSAAFEAVCGTLFPAGRPLRLEVAFTQHLDTVTALPVVDGLPAAPGTGAIAVDGSLQIETIAESGSTTMRQSWGLNAEGAYGPHHAAHVHGSVRITWSDSSLGTGSAIVVATLSLEPPCGWWCEED